MKDKDKKDKKGILGFILMGILGFLVSYLTSKRMAEVYKLDLGFYEILLKLLILVGSFYLSIIIHELGHLIFGLLSGYEFVSFRVGSLILYKSKSTYKLGRQTLPGTGGQCLLNLKSDDFINSPYGAYNLGGGIFNLIVSFLLVFLLKFRFFWPIDLLILYMVLVGLIFGPINLIPMRNNLLANDGENYKDLKSSKEARISFFTQLRINKLLVDGYRLREIDESLFTLRPDKSGLHEAIVYYNFERFLDMGAYKEAREFYESHIKKLKTGIYRLEAKKEMYFLDLLEGNNLDCYDDPELKKYNKLMKKTLGNLKISYGQALLLKNDPREGARILELFNKEKSRHPYGGEVKREEENIKKVDILYKS